MKIGFIGMGNMAQALAAGFLASGLVSREDVTAYAPNREKLQKNAERIGFVPAVSASEAASASEIVILACKPHQIGHVLEDCGEALKGRAVVSVAAGWLHGRFLTEGPGGLRIQCVMPNTPALIGKGVLLFEETHSLLPEERECVLSLFATAGEIIELPSALMGIGGAVSGCGPAFVDLMMEAYADAAVKYGMPRETAYRLIAGTAEGAAALLRATGEHPGVLKDRVCSPGGTTIRGVAALEKNGFRSACIASVDAVMGERK